MTGRLPKPVLGLSGARDSETEKAGLAVLVGAVALGALVATPVGLREDLVQFGALDVEVGMVAAEMGLHLGGVAEPKLALGALVDVHVLP